MFKKFKAKRANQIDTCHNPLGIEPILLNISQSKLFFDLLDYLKKNNYQDIKEYEKFYEIYARKEDDEFTFTITSEKEGISTLNIILYNQFKTGYAYKAIKITIAELTDFFGILVNKN